MANSVFIGLGSNLEFPLKQIKKAVRHIRCSKSVRLLNCSSIYASAPVGYDDQPDFINAVVEVSTKLKPLALLDLLQSIEHKQLRKRSSNRNAARTLDLDILLYEDLQVDSQRLTVPHPRMMERRFVLDPLLEICPNIIIPGSGPAHRFKRQLADQVCKRRQRRL